MPQSNFSFWCFFFFNRTSSLSHSITPPLHHSLSSASHLVASRWPTARPCGAAAQHNTARISKSFISHRLLIPTRGEDHREPMCVPDRKKKKRKDPITRDLRCPLVSLLATSNSPFIHLIPSTWARAGDSSAVSLVRDESANTTRRSIHRQGNDYWSCSSTPTESCSWVK